MDQLRQILARDIRRQAAELAFLRQPADQVNNGEEAAYTKPAGGGLSYIANYSKGLPHDQVGNVGEVNQAAYRALLRALASGEPSDFEQVPMGTPPPRRKFVNPQAALDFDLEGPDAWAVTIPPAPRIDGTENAAEMAELYWMALLRDVRFTDYGTGAGSDVGANNSAAAANALTNDFSAFRGPRAPGGNVTPATLFRGFTPGDLEGPYVSQFLLKPVVYGTLRISQRQKTARPDLDYLINAAEWLSIQDGATPAATDQFDTDRRFIRTPRDLATYVHFDALYEAYLNACLILLDMGAPFDPGNPYVDSTNQQGFGTFGGPHILSLVTEVASRALKAVWYQKWFVHRRLRPEAFGGLIHHHLAPGPPAYPINNEILAIGPGSTLDRIRNRNAAKGNNTYLLPQAFPEGSPLHPSYGAGHATVAGACVTILKAWFDESFPISNLVVPNASGKNLVAAPVPARPLTVGGELNKVAANIAIGRNMAGVHWRSDYTQSVKLGEAIAIQILREQKLCYNESSSLTVTRFDGTAVSI